MSSKFDRSDYTNSAVSTRRTPLFQREPQQEEKKVRPLIQLPSWLLPPGTRRKPFKAATPVPMPTKMPRCFNSLREWGIYKVLAQLTATKGFTFCTDCTPAHRDKMRAEGRCAFPGTQFGRNNGVIVGRRGK